MTELTDGWRRPGAGRPATPPPTGPISRDRAALGEVPEIAGVSAGGMPDRVKCLHALLGHTLAAGPGVNPIGDEAVAMIGTFWRPPCRGRPVSGAPVAAIDCGTNSFRLLIAEPDAEVDLRELTARMEIVRLGQGVDATGEFHPDALARTFAAADRYAEAIRAAGVPAERIRFVATSAARDARNGRSSSPASAAAGRRARR